MASTSTRRGGGKGRGSGMGVAGRRRTLDWGEALGANGGSGLAEGGGETVASTPDRSGVRFRRDCPLHVTGALWRIRMSRRTTSQGEDADPLEPALTKLPLLCIIAYMTMNAGTTRVILSYAIPTIRPKTMYPEKPIMRRLRRPVYLTMAAPRKTPGRERTERRRVHSIVRTMPAPGITEEMICEETGEVSAVFSSMARVRRFRERGEDGQDNCWRWSDVAPPRATPLSYSASP
jgi:hypothetical protein